MNNMLDCKRNNYDAINPTKKIILKRTQKDMLTDIARTEEAKKTKIN